MMSLTCWVIPRLMVGIYKNALNDYFYREKEDVIAVYSKSFLVDLIKS